jgi:hypothetical protein
VAIAEPLVGEDEVGVDFVVAAAEIDGDDVAEVFGGINFGEDLLMVECFSLVGYCFVGKVCYLGH